MKNYFKKTGCLLVLVTIILCLFPGCGNSIEQTNGFQSKAASMPITQINESDTISLNPLELFDSNLPSLIQTQNGYTLEVKSVATDGLNVRIIFGLTVPEGVELCKEDCTYGAIFGNFGNNSVLTPVIEDDYQWLGSGEAMLALEDNDGRDNTIQIIYETDVIPRDGDKKLCYEPDSSWKIQVRDINLERVEYPGGTYSGVVPLETAQGYWEFDITIPEDTDTRVIEFVDKPVTFETRGGGWWTPLQDVTITSFKLSSLKAEITWQDDKDGALHDQDQETCVVLKDGSRIPLNGNDYRIGNNFNPIPLNEVDYVELFNGIKLYPQR